MKYLRLVYWTATFAVVLVSASASAQGRLVAVKSTNGSFLVAEGGGGSALHANRPAQGPWERFTISRQNRRFGPPLVSGDSICLRTDNGHFVVAEQGGGREMAANRRECGPWETFTIWLLGATPAGLYPVGGEIPDGNAAAEIPVAFQASDGSWVVAEGAGGGDVNANRPALGPWERFILVQRNIH